MPGTQVPGPRGRQPEGGGRLPPVRGPEGGGRVAEIWTFRVRMDGCDTGRRRASQRLDEDREGGGSGLRQDLTWRRRPRGPRSADRFARDAEVGQSRSESVFSSKTVWV